MIVVMEAIHDLARSAPPAERAALLEQQLRESKRADVDYISNVLDVVELRWNVTITKLALDHLADLVARSKETWSQSRNCPGFTGRGAATSSIGAQRAARAAREVWRRP